MFQNKYFTFYHLVLAQKLMIMSQKWPHFLRTTPLIDATQKCMTALADETKIRLMILSCTLLPSPTADGGRVWELGPGRKTHRHSTHCRNCNTQTRQVTSLAGCQCQHPCIPRLKSRECQYWPGLHEGKHKTEKESSKGFIYLFIYWKLAAPSTTQVHLRA